MSMCCADECTGQHAPCFFLLASIVGALCVPGVVCGMCVFPPRLCCLFLWTLVPHWSGHRRRCFSVSTAKAPLTALAVLRHVGDPTLGAKGGTPGHGHGLGHRALLHGPEAAAVSATATHLPPSLLLFGDAVGGLHAWSVSPTNHVCVFHCDGSSHAREGGVGGVGSRTPGSILAILRLDVVACPWPGVVTVADNGEARLWLCKHAATVGVSASSPPAGQPLATVTKGAMGPTGERCCVGCGV